MGRSAGFAVVALGLLLAARATAAPDDVAPAWLLSIRSDSACPEAAAVDRRTRELLGLGPEVGLRESVELLHEGSGLAVRLRGDEQRLLGERVLPLDEDCDALSRAVSVVLASWLTDAHPEFLAARQTTPPDPVLPPPVTPPPAPAPRRVASRVDVRGELRVDERLRFRPEVAVGALVDSAGVVPAGSVGLGVMPHGSGLGVAARVAVSLQRTRPLGEGELVLLRWPLAVGAVVRLEHGVLAGELHAGAALAWLHLQGRGFSPDRSANDAALGAFGALRASLTLGLMEPFVELSAFGWPGAGSAYVDAPDRGVSLPRGELLPAVGAAFRW